jgi:CheY-like chemotaxis protein
LKVTQTVLVVEDEFIIRLDLVDTLEKAGFHTIDVASADEAIRVLEERSDIRAVFTDIEMPGSMDGLALARCIRERWPPTILIVCSGREKPQEHELPSKSEFLPKPYNPVQLQRVLDGISGELDRP